MTSAAHRAARNLTRDFGEVEHLQVSRKGPADFVSKADKKAEETLQYELAKARPNWGFLMEERGEVAAKDGVDARWIIDPLDGTTNFLHGLPHFSISIAAEIHGKVEAAVVFDPIKNEMFTAEKGRGAYIDDRRLRVSARTKPNDCILATGIPHLGRGDKALFQGELEIFMNKTAGIRRFGTASLDLAYVAAGRFDGFWEHDLKIWDIAAGILIIREAGGMVSECEGGDEMLKTGSIMAANSDIHSFMESELRPYYRNFKKANK
jgi:myo-inositol-1(or 4)-monophosphatase